MLKAIPQKIIKMIIIKDIRFQVLPGYDAGFPYLRTSESLTLKFQSKTIQLQLRSCPLQ